MRVASAAWRIRDTGSEAGFLEHLRRFVQSAAEDGAELLVLPELLILELLPLHSGCAPEDVPGALAGHAERYEAELEELARSSQITVVGGSHFRRVESGFANVCSVRSPSGATDHFKNALTRYEREVWGLVPGASLTRCSDPRVGVAVCYDSEFPEAGRALAEEGIEVLCIPSLTETRHGFHRVRHCAHARAVENQIFALHASLVGSLGVEPVPTTHGAAAVLAPSHPPFPPDGVIAETPLNEEGLAIADLDFEALLECRRSGSVTNWLDRARDWSVGR